MSETVFKTKVEILRYLQDGGWKIGRSQFYDHCRDGLLRPTKKDGRYHLKAVEKYAKLNVARLDTGQKVRDREDVMREEKLTISLEREKVGLKREKHDLATRQGRYILRSEFELAIVARAVAFMAHLNHTIQVGAPDWIDLVEGEQSRAPELVDAVSKSIEQRMGDFAADAEFEIILEGH